MARALQGLQGDLAESVAGAQIVEGGIEFRTVAVGAGGGFGEDFLADGAAERADLQLWGLVPGRDPGVSDKQVPSPSGCRENGCEAT